VLDIGGGNGYVARNLQSAGYRVTLLEPSETGCRHAHVRGIADVICASFDPALFHAGSIEVAGLFDVIEHVEDDVGMLRSVGQTLSPGGFVIITVPAFQWLFSQDDTLSGHYRRYNRGMVGKLLRASCLEVVHLSYFMAPLLPAVLLLRALPALFGVLPKWDQRRHARDHGYGSRLAPLATAVLGAEARMIAYGMRLPFGTSCLAIGRRAGPEMPFSRCP
jgi:SAM-dependent methyltransferase